MMPHRSQSIEEVYRRRHATFRSALATVVGDYELADDVVQESFARALARCDQYRGEGPLEAWIWRIALRTALEHRRAETDVPLIETLDPQFVEPDRDPALAAAVRKLPPRRRLVVFLRYIGDLSYSEIANACGIDEGTVGATLVQARAALADELGYTRAHPRALTGRSG
jgi:RNA polymerase sigma-70 factor, ECF subfamily